jgi:Family of unknown function (DUF6196)
MAVVNISREKPHEIESRLRRVIQETKLTVYDEPYAFEEFPIGLFNEHADPRALALVRDDHVWSQLVKARADAPEPFVLWRFHFPTGADNSGFVGWLAMHLKKSFGTGVFVVCGQNSKDGGIFDYWGCPWELRESVLDEVSALVTAKA